MPRGKCHLNGAGNETPQTPCVHHLIQETKQRTDGDDGEYIFSICSNFYWQKLTVFVVVKIRIRFVLEHIQQSN